MWNYNWMKWKWNWELKEREEDLLERNRWSITKSANEMESNMRHS